MKKNHKESKVHWEKKDENGNWKRPNWDERRLNITCSIILAQSKGIFLYVVVQCIFCLKKKSLSYSQKKKLPKNVFHKGVGTYTLKNKSAHWQKQICLQIAFLKVTLKKKKKVRCIKQNKGKTESYQTSGCNPPLPFFTFHSQLPPNFEGI